MYCILHSMLITRSHRHFTERQNAAGTKVISPEQNFIIKLGSHQFRQEGGERGEDVSDGEVQQEEVHPGQLLLPADDRDDTAAVALKNGRKFNSRVPECFRPSSASQ